MAGEILLVPLGAAIAQLLLNANSGSDPATLIGNAKDGWAALEKLRTGRQDRAVDAVGEAIARNLEPFVRGLSGEALQDAQAAAGDVAGLFNRTAEDLDAVRSAAVAPDAFEAYLRDHGGDGLRRRMASRTVPIFDRLLTAAAQEFTRLAPFSPKFVPAGIVRLLGMR